MVCGRGRERERQGGRRRAKQRITMASLPESSRVANPKLTHTGRHIHTHMHIHTDSTQWPGHTPIDGSSATFSAMF